VRIVLTGASGFVGGAVLERLLADDRVDAVTALVRRPLAVTSPRLTTVVHADFTAWSDAELDDLAGHDAVVWTVGATSADVPDPAELATLTHTTTLALARGLAARHPRMVFVYLSGMGADPAGTARLPWERLTRRLKGRTERDLQALDLVVRCLRPGGVLTASTSLLVRRLLAPIALGVDELAAALVRCALDPDVAPPTVRHAALRRLAAH
jgi:nucleoside-diphosphate-sugar epimerase